MDNTNFKLFSSQAAEIYRLLQKGKPLTAKEIGEELQIFPHAVYRSVKQLLEKGFVKEEDNYPVKYSVLPETEAMELFTTAIRHQFQNSFLKSKSSTTTFDVSFVNGRDDLQRKTTRDVSFAKKTVDFVVSGLEVEAETILTYKKAIDRGVRIRAIVQRLDDTSKQMFRNWEKIGLEIRYLPNMEARAFILDKEIVYFTSYNPARKQEAIGSRFHYRPYAKIMDELFEARWQIAKEI